MTIYEIDAELQQLIDTMVDPETGEVNEEVYTSLSELQMAREEKLENMACALIGLKREKEAVAAERKKLEKSEESLEKAIDRLNALLLTSLNGEKIDSPRVKVWYRKTESTEVDKDFVEWAATNKPELLNFDTPRANRTAIKQFLKDGGTLDKARIVEKQSLVIK